MRLVGNAHLVAGDAASIADVLALVRSEGIPTDGNPDMYVREYAHFGVDDARELRERADLSAQGERRVFVIATPLMTAEAQNALLKTLEEPRGNALFFIIVPSPETLLATLRSRMQRIELTGTDATSPIDAGDFLAAEPARRLDMLKPLLEKNDDDLPARGAQAGRRDIAGIVMFLSSLERMLSSMSRTESREGLAAVYRARAYLADKGSLVKPLLEQVALLVPRMRT